MRAERITAAAPSRRERRKADTRRRLIEAARALFSERGYDATRPQDIARSADVAAGTFYVHFDDKQDAFLAFTDQVAGELTAFIHGRVAGTGTFEEILERSLEALFEYSFTHPGVLAAATAEAAVNAAGLPPGASLVERLADILDLSMRRGIERGEVPDDYDPQLIAHGVVGFVHHALVYGARHGTDPTKLLENLNRFCARALVAPSSGRKALDS